MYRKILERTWLSYVLQEFGTVPRDARSLHDKVLGEELTEALDVVVLIRLDVVIVQLLNDRRILGRRLDVIQRTTRSTPRGTACS